MSSVSSDPSALGLLIFSLVGWGLLWFRGSEQRADMDSRVGRGHRLAAFFIDLFVVMMTTFPPSLFFTLVVEWLMMGEWAWSFERELRWWDALTFPIMFVSIGATWFWYVRRGLNRGTQTWGQRLMGYQLVTNGDRPSLLLRGLVAWMNFAWWPTWPWTILRKKQDYWWEHASQIVARRVAEAP